MTHRSSQQQRRRRIFATAAIMALGLATAWCGTQENVTAQDDVQNVTQSNTEVVEKLDNAIGSLSDDIMKYMSADESAGKSIVLESLRGPNQTVSGKMAQMLRKQFEDAEYKIVSGGAYTVTGRYMTGERGGVSVAKFNVQLLNRSGAQVQEFQREITDIRDGIDLLSPTFDVSQDNALPKEELKAKITDAVEQPNVFTANSLVKATPDSPYAVEILVWDGQKYVAAPVDKTDGIAACDVKSSQEFAIRIHNNTDQFVGAQITLDGINMYAFSKNQFFKDFGRMAIFPKQAPIIKGWHDDGDQSFSFKVTNYGESAASQLGVVESVGTITVTFFRAYEDKDGTGPTIPGNQNAVGFGTPRKMVYVPVKVKIPADEIIGAISVKYSRPTDPGDLPDGG